MFALLITPYEGEEWKYLFFLVFRKLWKNAFEANKLSNGGKIYHINIFSHSFRNRDGNSSIIFRQMVLRYPQSVNCQSIIVNCDLIGYLFWAERASLTFLNLHERFIIRLCPMTLQSSCIITHAPDVIDVTFPALPLTF